MSERRWNSKQTRVFCSISGFLRLCSQQQKLNGGSYGGAVLHLLIGNELVEGYLNYMRESCINEDHRVSAKPLKEFRIFSNRICYSPVLRFGAGFWCFLPTNFILHFKVHFLPFSFRANLQSYNRFRNTQEQSCRNSACRGPLLDNTTSDSH